MSVMLLMRLASLLFVLSTIGCSTTKYYIIRHAEKLVLPPENPPLSPEGMQRANALRDLLHDEGIDSIFVSEFLRTQQTAQPIADRMQTIPARYATNNIQALLSRLQAMSGYDVLIVSHGGLVEQIVDGLSGMQVGPIGEFTYDSVFIVSVTRFLSTSTSLERTTYGAPSGQ